jgi:2-dehydro-3-deoxygluconokinase
MTDLVTKDLVTSELVTLGECMALLVPSPGRVIEESQSLSLDVAGAESNLCIALARLGRTVRYISKVGSDPFGRLIRAVLEREGVDTSALLVDPVAPTGVFFRESLPDGQRRVYYYRSGSAASRLAPGDLSPEQFTGAKYLHLTGITPALSEANAQACQHAIRLARQAGAKVSFDPNYRRPLWDIPTARPVLLDLASQADILLMGHEDARALWDVQEESAVLEQGAKLGAQIVVLKLAERGACALAGGERFDVPAEPVDRVVDPVGAGDGFDAGFLAGLLRGEPVESALHLAARVGAAAVRVMGDYAAYPRL